MLYEKLFRHCLYPAYESVLRGRKTFQYYKSYDMNQWLPEDELKALQWRCLSDLIRHSYENVPYYRKVWRELDIRPEDIRAIEDFQKLPVLTKDLVRENYDDLIAANYRGNTMTKATGGSTGIPFKFEYTRESYERRTAVTWRGYEWSGLPIGKRTAYLWGTDLGNVSGLRKLKTFLYQRAFNRLMLNSFVMTHDNMNYYVDSLNAYKPEGIVSYVAPLYTLARHIREKGLDIHSPEVIVTGAEPLHEFQRELIESVFSCPVSNTYGCREFMLVAAECKDKQGLHINEDHLVVETLNQRGESVKGDSGRVAVTDLFNYGMPLIRYLNGDLASIDNDKCTCGRALALMRSVEGRELDSIKTKQGSILPGEFFPHLIKDVPGIDFFQVVQDSLEGIKIFLVPNERFKQSGLDYISLETRKVMGDDFEIAYELVDQIELTKSGKRRVTVSHV